MTRSRENADGARLDAVNRTADNATVALKAPLATPTFTGKVTAPSLILTPRTVPTSPAPVEGQIYYNNADNVIYMYTGAVWQQLTNVPFGGTGGNSIVTSGAFKIHVFTASGTFTPNMDGTVDWLVVAGGGSSSGASGGGSGGGGAGGFRTGASLAVTENPLTITVGAGGVGATTGSNTAYGANGVDSSIVGADITNIVSTGGGASGPAGNNSDKVGQNGGSGGGAGSSGHSDSSASATVLGGSGNTPSTSPSQGNNGGNYVRGSYTWGAGGGASGGGAGAVGLSPNTESGGRDGGIGKNEIMGLSASDSNTLLTAASAGHSSGGTRYFAGGGASGSSATPIGVGGLGGGGGNATVGATSHAVAGTANTGGGASGAYGASGAPANGGSGIIIIRYAI